MRYRKFDRVGGKVRLVLNDSSAQRNLVVMQRYTGEERLFCVREYYATMIPRLLCAVDFDNIIICTVFSDVQTFC